MVFPRGQLLLVTVYNTLKSRKAGGSITIAKPKDLGQWHQKHMNKWNAINMKTQIQTHDGGEAAFWMRKLKQSKTERFEPAVQWASRQKDLQTCKNMQKHAPISLAWTCTLQRDNIWYGTVWSGLYWSNLTCSVWCGQNLKYNMAYVPSRLSMDIQYCTWSKIHQYVIMVINSHYL